MLSVEVGILHQLDLCTGWEGFDKEHIRVPKTAKIWYTFCPFFKFTF